MVNMAGFKIVFEREKCIGCGNCAALCPENWEMAADGKSRAKTTELAALGCNKEAAENCPVKCIKVKETKK